MRSQSLFRRQFNAFLDHLDTIKPGERILSERATGRAIGTSRTTVRKCLAAACDMGLLTADGIVLRRARPSERYTERETAPPTVLVERAFLTWILQSDSGPGQAINALQLSRQFGVSTTTIREFLQSFRHFGLLDRQPGGRWVFRGVTAEFVNELSDIREIFEMRSVMRFIQLDEEHPGWAELRALRGEHVALLSTIETDYHRFSLLDERLHRLINSASGNRFVTEFYDVISLIFFYHYQWNKKDERSRNEAAVYQHLAYIDAIMMRDRHRVVETCTAHLEAARRTLFASLG
jgi:DNA-binding GntR family transcriptional regulator